MSGVNKVKCSPSGGTAIIIDATSLGDMYTEIISNPSNMSVVTSTAISSSSSSNSNKPVWVEPKTLDESDEAVSMDASSSTTPVLSQLCRTCASTHEYLIPIFEGEGADHKLDSKIERHLPIKVSVTDLLPLQLCYQCATTIIAFDNLLNTCLSADKKLKLLLEGATSSAASHEEPYEEKHTLDDGLHNETDDADSDDEPLSKTKIEKIKPTEKKLVRTKRKPSVKLVEIADIKEEQSSETERLGSWSEMNKPHVSSSTPSSSSSSSRRTTSDYPPEMESVSIVTSTGSLRKVYRCRVCGHTSNRSNNLRVHLRTHVELPGYVCASCGKKRTERMTGMLDVEVSSVNEGKKTYRCRMCGHQSNRSYNVRKHLQCHLPPITCDSCGGACHPAPARNYRIKEAELLRARQTNGRIRNTFRCRLCGQLFLRRSLLSRHLATHKTINVHICRECNREYLNETALNDHMRVSHAPATAEFRCEWCANEVIAFRTEDELHVHQLTHLTHQCPYCGDAFPTQNALYDHSKVHLTDLDAQC